MSSPVSVRVLMAFLFLCVASIQETRAADDPVSGTTFRVYIGTYTGAQSQGIYHSTVNLDTGELTPPQLAVEVTSPSFLAIHPNRKFLYAVGEVSDFQGQKAGSVNAFAIDSATGGLTRLNEQSSFGTGPCHLVVDRAGTNVLVANYGGGSVAVLPIDPASGRLAKHSSSIQHMGSSANPQRQESPHAHSINLDAANHFAFAADLGLDKVLIYRFDPVNGTLKPNDPPATALTSGSGPRHFAFHPTGKFAFVNNELTSSVTSFRYDSDKGVLTEMHTLSTLPSDFKGGNSTAETVAHPSGRFVYVSNRGHDSIAIFKVDTDTGKLTAEGHCLTGGKTPRNFNVDPTGRLLIAANQSTNSLVVFRIDQTTGQLTPTGSKIEVGSPVCVRFVPLGK